MADENFDADKKLSELLPQFYSEKPAGNVKKQESAPSKEESDSWQYGVVGAPAGAVIGKALSGFKPPEYSTKAMDVARENLQKANAALETIKESIETHKNIPRPQLQALEYEYILRQEAFRAAEENLHRAMVEAASVSKPVTEKAIQATVSEGLVPTPEQHARGFQGNMKEVKGGAPITSRASMQTFNENTAHQAFLKQQQEAQIADMVRRGLVTPEGADQIRNRLGKLASTPSGNVIPAHVAMDIESQASSVASKAASEEAIRKAELERLKQELSLRRREMGEAKSAFGAEKKPISATEARLTGKLSDAEMKANLATKELQRIAAEAPSEGFLKRAGRFISSSPKLAGALGGAGIGLSVAEAMERFDRGDTSGGVLEILSAALGGMSMVPPIGPAALAVKGAGTIGGLGMIPVMMAHDYLKR